MKELLVTFGSEEDIGHMQGDILSVRPNKVIPAITWHGYSFQQAQAWLSSVDCSQSVYTLDLSLEYPNTVTVFFKKK